MDIKYADNGDIDISSGDITYLKGVEQHKLTVLLPRKGEIKHRPDVGVGIVDYLLDNEPGELLREARLNCMRVGMNIERVYFDKNELKIIGDYDS